jgi:xanthine dehydrogenase accessory factor
MRDILGDLALWQASGETIALATVVQAEGSSPRPPGAQMATAASGLIAGSISGGCLESAIVEEAQSVLAGGPPKRLRYGAVGEDSLQIGLACGGSIEVYVEQLAALHHTLIEALADEETMVLATDLTTGAHLLAWPDGRQLGDRSLAGVVEEKPATPLAELRQGPQGDVFLQVFLPRPTLVVVGATEAGRSLVTLSHILGFRTRVIDARAAFATAERFPEADELTVAWPQKALQRDALGRQHYVAILSHDPKFDLPALRVALRSEAAYVGLLGSHVAQARRHEALRQEGFSEQQISRIHGPVGLDLGGQSPAEIALAVIAEVVAVRNGRAGRIPGRS